MLLGSTLSDEVKGLNSIGRGEWYRFQMGEEGGEGPLPCMPVASSLTRLVVLLHHGLPHLVPPLQRLDEAGQRLVVSGVVDLTGG